MTHSDSTKAFIEKYFDGNEEAFNEVMHVEDPEADAHRRKYYRTAVRWKDIDLHSKSYPEYEELSLAWIRYLLGYLPEPRAYMPSLAFIQTLVQSTKANKISEQSFLEELFWCVQQIRNKDIKQGGWLLNLTYDNIHYDRYNRHLLIYKQAARERLCKFLGYEPLLEHSLEAEMFLRQTFAEDFFHSKFPLCNADYKAATIVKYREIFLTQGEEEADKSELLYIDREHLSSAF